MNGPHSSTFYWYPTCSVRLSKTTSSSCWKHKIPGWGITKPSHCGGLSSQHTKEEGKTMLQEERLCAFIKRSHWGALQMEVCLAHSETCSTCFQNLVTAASNSFRNWSLRPGTFVQLAFPTCPPWGSPRRCSWQSFSVPHHCIFQSSFLNKFFLKFTGKSSVWHWLGSKFRKLRQCSLKCLKLKKNTFHMAGLGHLKQSKAKKKIFLPAVSIQFSSVNVYCTLPTSLSWDWRVTDIESGSLSCLEL